MSKTLRWGTQEHNIRTRNILSVSFTLAIFSNFFLSSYLGIAIANTLSFKVDDGWCDPTKQGFGRHCFGDFYAPLLYANSASPWDSPINNYPPLAFLILKPFAILDSVFQGRVALCVYLLLSIVCLLFPILHAFWKKMLTADNAIFLGTIFILSAPTITVLDRGNNLSIVYPFVYLFFYNLYIQNYSRSTYFALIFVLFKPQLILLTIVLLASGKFVQTLKIYGMVLIGFFVGFLAYPKDLIGNISKWILGTVNYQNYASSGVLQPVNVSIKSSVDILFNIFGDPANSAAVQVACYILFIASTINYFKNFGNRSLQQNFLLVSLMPIFFVGTTFQYYLILLLIPLLFQFVHTTKISQDNDYSQTKSYTNVTLVIFVLAFTPLALPWSLLGDFIPEGWANISATWLLSQIGLTIFGTLLYWMPTGQEKARIGR